MAFVTFGAVSAKPSVTKPAGLLIEEIDDERDLREESFDNALACLHDTSVPIRAHGLILFRRLIERADAQSLSKIEDNEKKLLKRFQEHLHADDSYEYLAAINVLSALADRYTERILPILCDEYVHGHQRTRNLEDSLKVGEILVKTCRSLGKRMLSRTEKCSRYLLPRCYVDQILVPLGQHVSPRVEIHRR